MYFHDLTGKKFGRVLVIGPWKSEPDSKGRPISRWFCRCDCGTERWFPANTLKMGRALSCGCRNKEQIHRMLEEKKPYLAAHARNTVHGYAKHDKESKEYRAWMAMNARCYNPNYSQYHDYGGRGITVCDKWRYSFPAFFEDVGPAPSSKYSIDRKDNDGNYTPDNVKWSTHSEQMRNRRK